MSILFGIFLIIGVILIFLGMKDVCPRTTLGGIFLIIISGVWFTNLILEKSKQNEIEEQNLKKHTPLLEVIKEYPRGFKNTKAYIAKSTESGECYIILERVYSWNIAPTKCIDVKGK